MSQTIGQDILDAHPHLSPVTAAEIKCREIYRESYAKTLRAAEARYTPLQQQQMAEEWPLSHRPTRHGQ